MKRLWYGIFIGVVVFSILVRLYRLESIPSGFHADEASFGYNSYSILKTGMDEYGKSFPLVLRSFDDYKRSFYSYVTIPFIQVFGLNEWSVRLPSSLAGIGIVLLTFFIVRNITKRNDMATVSSCIVGISPMLILLSRVQSDPVVAMFFVLLGIYFFLRWIDTKSTVWFIATSLSWVLAICTYYSPWAFIFAFGIGLVKYFWKGFTKRQKLENALLYIFLLGVIFFLLSSFHSARYSQVSVFQKPDILALVEEGIREDTTQGVPVSLARLYHNKPIDFGRFLIYNYSRYFSFEFLFYQAGEPARERIPNSGVFLMVELPFLLFGIYSIFKKKYRWGYLFLYWFLLVPALSVFATDETPNIHRFALAGIPEAVIVSCGILELYVVIQKKKRRIGFLCIVIGAYFLNFSAFAHELFFHQPVHYPFYRDYAYKELVMNLEKRYDSYHTFVVTQDKGNAYIHFLFHLRYDPMSYLLSGSHGNEPFGSFDKFIFVPIKCPTEEELRKTGKVSMGFPMLVVKGGKCPEKDNERIIDIVKWRDGSEAFQLVEYNSL